jgi:hypothetical protein
MGRVCRHLGLPFRRVPAGRNPSRGGAVVCPECFPKTSRSYSASSLGEPCPACVEAASRPDFVRKPCGQCATPTPDIPGLVGWATYKERPTDPYLGRRVGGRFTVVEFLADGGQGGVYKALQAPLRRVAAVKLLNATQGNAARDLAERLKSEAAILARIRHPGVPMLLDYGLDTRAYHYLALEFVDGVTLEKLLETHGVDEFRAAQIMVDTLSALHAAHHHGVVHRDVKPANVMIARDANGDDRVTVIDFGIAKIVRGDRDLPAAARTAPTIQHGTPLYMAPEQAAGEPADARTDIYQAGVVLYELLAGCPPFTEGGPFQILLAHQTKAVPPIGGLSEPGVRARLASVALRALEKSPAARYQSANEMAAAVWRAVSPEGPLPEHLRRAEHEALGKTVAVTVPKPAGLTIALPLGNVALPDAALPDAALPDAAPGIGESPRRTQRIGAASATVPAATPAPATVAAVTPAPMTTPAPPPAVQGRAGVPGWQRASPSPGRCCSAGGSSPHRSHRRPRPRTPSGSMRARRHPPSGHPSRSRSWALRRSVP